MAITKMSVSGIARNNKSNQLSAPPFFYAVISTANTGSFYDGGALYDYWDFTTNGSLVVVAPGIIDVVVVGGGGMRAIDSGGTSAGGAGGGVRWGLVYAEPSTISVTIGSGSGSSEGNGSQSSFGTLMKIGGGQGGYGQGLDSGARGKDGFGGGGNGAAAARVGTGTGGGAGGLVFGSNLQDGVLLNYNGTVLEFGRGGTGTTAVASLGHGSNNSSASSNGRVIAKIKKS